MLKVSHTKPLYDATALMADEARTQSQQSVHKEANDKCSFAKISENNKDWCNGRGKQGKDALACVPKVSQGCETNKAHTDPHPTKSNGDSANAKPYKHTDDCSTKSEWDSAFRGIVRFWEGWFGRKGGGAFERVVGMARFDAAIPQSCDR